MAEVILRGRLAEVGVTASVASVGTLGWSRSGATPHAVEAVHELGFDLGDHVSRRLGDEHLDVDLVLAMTRVHAGAVIARDKSIAPCVFLPGELARLLAADERTEETMTARIRRLGGARGVGPLGRAGDEVPDPAGEALDVYRSTAARLDRDLTSLARRLARYGS